MKPSTERDGKFDAKSRPCVYLGPAFKGASKLWDPVANKELVDHSVTFDEDNTASRLLHDHQLQSGQAVPSFGFLNDEDELQGQRQQGNQQPQQLQPHPVPQTHQQGPQPPALQQAMQDALRSRVVPSDILPSVTTIADGGQVSRDALATVARRLAA
ncbi:unnamed protein product, partial [Tilletia controversa]